MLSPNVWCCLWLLLQGIADGRITLMGRAAPIADEAEKMAAKAVYMAKHPNSFWVEFGDFAWFRMNEVVAARLVAGFARAGTVRGDMGGGACWCCWWCRWYW
jgi:hypothetical protein